MLTVARANYNGKEYSVFLNNGDRRCYRTLVCLVDDGDPTTTFNREFTTEEHIGLYLVTSLVKQAYDRAGLIGQSDVMGNASHEFDPETRVTQLGTVKEPCLLHAHILGR